MVQDDVVTGTRVFYLTDHYDSQGEGGGRNSNAHGGPLLDALDADGALGAALLAEGGGG